MTDLSCSVTSCMYNNSKEGLCSLEHIRVGGHDAVVSSSTECSSFREADMSGKNSSKCDCSSARPGTDIECMAEKCVYNCGCNCTADHIQVDGRKADCCAETCCETFCIE